MFLLADGTRATTTSSYTVITTTLHKGVLGADLSALVLVDETTTTTWQADEIEETV